nr:hypothetical protein [Sorangium cellulosum]
MAGAERLGHQGEPCAASGVVGRGEHLRPRGRLNAERRQIGEEPSVVSGILQTVAVHHALEVRMCHALVAGAQDVLEREREERKAKRERRELIEGRVLVEAGKEWMVVKARLMSRDVLLDDFHGLVISKR